MPSNYYQNKEIHTQNQEKTLIYAEKPIIEQEKKTNFARNIRGNLLFYDETEEEKTKKENQKNEYKNYIENQIADRQKQKEIERQIQIEKDLIEESKYRKQIDEINLISSDSKHFDISSTN